MNKKRNKKIVKKKDDNLRYWVMGIVIAIIVLGIAIIFEGKNSKVEEGLASFGIDLFPEGVFGDLFDSFGLQSNDDLLAENLILAVSCVDNFDCIPPVEGRCEGGVCVYEPDAPVPDDFDGTNNLLKCPIDFTCSVGHICKEGICVLVEAPPVPEGEDELEGIPIPENPSEEFDPPVPPKEFTCLEECDQDYNKCIDSCDDQFSCLDNSYNCDKDYDSCFSGCL